MSNLILTEHGHGERIRPFTREERFAQLVAMQHPNPEKLVQEEEEQSAALLEHMSPPGALHLPELLERKRLAYGITDHFFRHQALFDRVFLFQVHEGDGKTYGSGIIEMPEDQRSWEKEQAPQAILLSAGLTALDNLRSHGVDLGHTVIMNKLTPYHFRVGHIRGLQLFSLIARDGDLCGSLETMRAQKERRCSVVQQIVKDPASGLESMQHVLKDEGGHLWAPNMPWISDDQ